MSMLRTRSLRLAALALGCAVAPALDAQSYNTWGVGCPGAAGAPALHANGLPALGYTLQVDLTQVAPGSVGILFFGLAPLGSPIDLGFLGSPGCLVLVLPDLTSIIVPAPLGTAAVNLAIPPDPALAGATWENQWLVLDPGPGTFTTSNGGTATLGALPPFMSIGSVVPNAGLLNVGQPMTIRVTNLCTSQPDDICLQLSDGFGGRSLLRATSIVFDPSTNEDVVTATLMTANVSPIAVSQLVLMRGDGDTGSAGSSACLTLPPSAWAWGGVSLPGFGSTLPTNVIPNPPGTVSNASFFYDSASNSMFVDIPPYPWAGSGLYPPGSSIITDAHGDLACGGGTPTNHFDQFIEPASVKAACAPGLTNQQLAIEHAPQVQQTFENWFGPGRLTVTAETTGALARIRIKPTNPNCVLTGGGGSVVVHQ